MDFFWSPFYFIWLNTEYGSYDNFNNFIVELVDIFCFMCSSSHRPLMLNEVHIPYFDKIIHPVIRMVSVSILGHLFPSVIRKKRN